MQSFLSLSLSILADQTDPLLLAVGFGTKIARQWRGLCADASSMVSVTQ